ncbi:MAG: 1-acyl-sn-glycerol-3-phosphate acyltransferase, partial [Synergistaceae bacterium]|nr:1-acyl-sn-glycerol-3-phosphate acyltransferase [Synergistaceae bacterium]
MLKFLIKLFFRILYRPEIKLETLSRILETGERAVLAPHHASFIDPLLFALFSPREPVAVISPSMTRQKWFKFIKRAFKYVVVDQNDPFAAKHINDLWKKHDFLVVCPEPEPTTNGILMKISDSVVSALEASGAWVIPARACNTQFTAFSRMEGRLVQVTAPKVTLLSGKAERIREPSADGTGRGSSRLKMERMLGDVMMLGL